MPWYSPLEKYIYRIRAEVVHLKKGVFTKGTFAQNFAFVFSGRAVIIIMQVIFAPILARIYSPEAYGVFSLFTAVTTNLALVSTLRLEGALVLPREDKEFKQLLKSVFLIALGFSLLVTIATILGKSQIDSYFDTRGLGILIYFLGPVVFLLSFFQITTNWVTRNKAFKDAFHYGIPINVGTRVFNVVYGIFTKGAAVGLVLADIVNKLITVIIRAVFILKSNLSFLRTRLSKAAFIGIIKKYKQFPLYDLPGNWINLFSSQLPIFLITSSFGANPVGQLGFAMSLLDIPMGLLGSSVAPVFLQKIAETNRNNPADVGRITAALYKRMFYLGLFPIALITVFGDVLFGWVFGVRWEMAGIFTGYLGVYYLMRLISSPLSSIYVVLGKQQKLFYFQVGLFIGRLISLSIGAFILKDVLWTVLLFGIFNVVAYLVLAFSILSMVKAHAMRLILKTVAAIVVVIGILYGIRYLIFDIS
jgi:O-antigen/teichoic acid export membrane protein